MACGDGPGPSCSCRRVDKQPAGERLRWWVGGRGPGVRGAVSTRPGGVTDTAVGSSCHQLSEQPWGAHLWTSVAVPSPVRGQPHHLHHQRTSPAADLPRQSLGSPHSGPPPPAPPGPRPRSRLSVCCPGPESGQRPMHVFSEVRERLVRIAWSLRPPRSPMRAMQRALHEQVVEETEPRTLLGGASNATYFTSYDCRRRSQLPSSRSASYFALIFSHL